MLPVVDYPSLGWYVINTPENVSILNKLGYKSFSQATKNYLYLLILTRVDTECHDIIQILPTDYVYFGSPNLIGNAFLYAQFNIQDYYENL